MNDEFHDIDIEVHVNGRKSGHARRVFGLRLPDGIDENQLAGRVVERAEQDLRKHLERETGPRESSKEQST